MKQFARQLVGVVAAVGLSLSAGSAFAQTLKVETGNASGLTTLIPQLLAKSLEGSGVSLRINSNQTLTRSALSLGTGRINIAIVPPPAYNAMSRAVGPYKKAGEMAKKAASNIRSLFPFAGGVFQPIVWADSGIKTWKDMKGKRIFIGPPAGSANRQISSLLQLAGGLKLGKDYQPVRLGWGAAVQAFQDGQFDVFVAAFPVGAAAVQQLSLQRKIRIIGVPAAVLKTKQWHHFLGEMGATTASIAPGSYPGQVNNNVRLNAAAYSMVFGVNKKMSDDLAYKITKTYWANIEDYKKSVAVLAQLPTDDPLAGDVVPLHPGAARYYKEKGIAIPADLQPTK